MNINDFLSIDLKHKPFTDNNELISYLYKNNHFRMYDFVKKIIDNYNSPNANLQCCYYYTPPWDVPDRSVAILRSRNDVITFIKKVNESDKLFTEYIKLISHYRYNKTIRTDLYQNGITTCCIDPITLYNTFSFTLLLPLGIINDDLDYHRSEVFQFLITNYSINPHFVVIENHTLDENIFIVKGAYFGKEADDDYITTEKIDTYTFHFTTTVHENINFSGHIL